MTTDTPKPTSSTWDDVKRIADEVKLKLHLASMEAKEQWKKLEPKVNELEAKVMNGSEKAVGAVGDQVAVLATGLRQFADELRDSVAKLKPEAKAEAKAEAAKADDATPDDTKTE